MSGSQQATIPPLTMEEEDQIIHVRITNDERPLRRIIKKFHNYTALSHKAIVPMIPAPSNTSIDHAREAFLVELASFQLLLKKSAMICEAEARQVEEYKRERQKIEDEHGTLRGQIEQLKTSLDHAQLQRRRKIEYDLVAEKVNTLPSRDELEQSIQALESDMAAIKAEHEHQNKTIQEQKASLDRIIADLGSLRFLGKDRDASTSIVPSLRGTPAPDAGNTDAEDISERATSVAGRPDNDEEEREEDADKQGKLGATLDDAREDIEMGEVEEDPKDNKSKKRHREDLEEGEASDTSSALSEPPDD